MTDRLTPPDADAPDVVARRREKGRARSRKQRERLALYGPGYRVLQSVLAPDVADLLAARFPVIAAALAADDDEELGRLLDGLMSAFAYGELGAFEDDPPDYTA